MMSSYGAYLWSEMMIGLQGGAPWLAVGYVAGLLSMLAIRG